jgi:HPt (histidine-containing phosphotransfer) domain-containing protein
LPDIKSRLAAGAGMTAAMVLPRLAKQQERSGSYCEAGESPLIQIKPVWRSRRISSSSCRHAARRWIVRRHHSVTCNSQNGRVFDRTRTHMNQNPHPTDRLGKYRDLVIAIALFLALDLGVLTFNFHASGRIEAGTSKINASGELRMYSQQLTKAILTLAQETRDGLPIQTSQAQISESYQAFNKALLTLKASTDNSTDTGWLSGRDAAEEAALVRRVEDYWLPLEATVRPLLGAATPEVIDIEIAATKFVTRNIRLMQLADDLTRHLESGAIDTAGRLRTIQLVAILLALLNFVFIVFKFVRALRKSDRAAEAAREETDEILATVREGLFLLDRDGCIGSQRSLSLDNLFGRPVRTGERFAETLSAMVRPEVAETAADYLSLLFNEKVKPRLLTQLNPLHEVAINGAAGGSREEKHLTFEFDQVRSDNRIVALLVTVLDVSERVRLRRELAGAEEQVRHDVDLLLATLDQDPALVKSFLAATQEKLDLINADLQQIEPDPQAYADMVHRLFRHAHSIKGEAATLGFATIAREAHAFEDRLAPLRGRADVGGAELIPLAVSISALREQVMRLNAVFEKASNYAQRPLPAHPLDPMLKQIERLALTVAEDLNKKVRFESALASLSEMPPAFSRLLHEAVPQLVRNAVAHGIESAEERLRAGKPAEGTVRVEIDRQDDGVFAISVWDDGRGISAEALRRQLVESGRKSAAEADGMSDREVVAMLFEAGFTSSATANPHAGRGVGLDLIRDLIANMGARLRIATLPNAYTRFTLLVRA